MMGDSRMNKFFQSLVLCFSGLQLFGCPKSGGNNAKNNVQGSQFVGSWTVNCLASSYGQSPVHRNAKLIIEESREFKYSQTTFSDASCSNKLYEEASSGKIEWGENNDSSTLKIKLIESSGSGTFLKENFAATHSELGTCGFKDWKINEPKDLLGTGCIGFSEAGTSDGLQLTIDEGASRLSVLALPQPNVKKLSSGDTFTKN